MVGTNISLRALEPDDLSFLYRVENNVDNWKVSETIVPFSKYILYQYLENIDKNITNTGQLRLVITNNETSEAVGLIDLFNFDGIHRRCSIGIIINSEARKQGYGQETLELILDYCKHTLNLHQVYCEIQAENKTSVTLFEKLDFVKTGVKKDWFLSNGEYSDVYFYQKIL